jgi:hypothetical protein
MSSSTALTIAGPSASNAPASFYRATTPQ